MRYRNFALPIGIALSALFCLAQAQSSITNDPWASFQFLLGSWSGTGSGQPGEVVAGSTSFSFDLRKNILVRKNRAELAPKPGEAEGTTHEDLIIIYRQPGESRFWAIYFDNEGHVINYRVSFPAKQQSVIFETDALEKGPRFRFIYELGPDGLLSNEFLIAAPGGEFKTYTKGKLNRDE